MPTNKEIYRPERYSGTLKANSLKIGGETGANITPSTPSKPSRALVVAANYRPEPTN